MKKISVLSLLSVIMLPAFAEDAAVKDVVAAEEAKVAAETTQAAEQADVVMNKADLAKDLYETNKTSNPKIKFPHGLQLGIGVSPTSGLNGFVGYNNKNFDSFWAKRFGIRFDFATYSPIKSKLNKAINDDIGDKGFEVGGDLNVNNLAIDAKHYGAVIDFYPFGNTWFLGGWRISGGYFVGDLKLDADILAKNIGGDFHFDLGDQKFYYEGTEMKGKASVKWKYSGPYLGTGFDLGLFWGFKLYMDAGVVFSDKSADLNLNVPLDNLKHEGSGDAVLESELNAAKEKAIADAQKELDKYPYYPIVKLGFMYRF